MDEVNHAAHNPDFYWQSTNLERLVSQAKAHAHECGAASPEELSRCAEHVVRAEVCSCISTEESVIGALVLEVTRITLLERE